MNEFKQVIRSLLLPLPLLLPLLGVTGCRSGPNTSSESSWLTCTATAECVGYREDLVCDRDGYCADRNGIRVDLAEPPRPFTLPSGRQSGSAGAPAASATSPSAAGAATERDAGGPDFARDAMSDAEAERRPESVAVFEEAGTDAASCAEGSALCDGASLRVCTNGVFVELETCLSAELCNSFGQICLPPDCTNGEQRCNGAWFESCEEGSWQALQDCTLPAACDSNGGCLLIECPELIYQCIDNVLYRCGPDQVASEWVEVERCEAPFECVASQPEPGCRTAQLP